MDYYIFNRTNSCDNHPHSISKVLQLKSSNLSNNPIKESSFKYSKSTSQSLILRPSKSSSSKHILRKIHLNTAITPTSSSSIISFIASNITIPSNTPPSSHRPSSDTQSLLSSFTINSIISTLNTSTTQGIIDTLVNIIYSKYINCSLFYTPQLCCMISYKPSSSIESIENYLLDCCIDKIKFSIIIYWLVSANSNQAKMEQLLNKIEMTLVNCRRATFSSFNSFLWSKAQSEYAVFQLSVNKEMRLNYFNIVIQFYEEITVLCDALKKRKSKRERNVMLRKEIGNFNQRIREMYGQLDDMAAIDDSIRGLYRGILLPFDDHQSVKDNCSNVIVGILPKMSFCFTTKARVPVKLMVECVRVYECDEWEKLYIEKEEEDDGKEVTTMSDYVMTTTTIGDENLGDCKSSEEYEAQVRRKDDEMKVKKQQALNQKEINKILKDIQSANDNPKNEDKNKKDVLLQERKDKEKEKDRNSIIRTFTSEIIDLFGNKWSDVVKEQKIQSAFKNFLSYSLKSFIAKSNDDLRQEVLSMQIIKQFDIIFRKADIPLKIQPYEIIVTSSSSGLIEFLPNTISIDALKKSLPTTWTLNTFFRHFYSNIFEEAQKNFTESLAAYSLLTYLINIKDRHNGNILLDINGNIIHIDFGFILGISPGGINFENAPFKLTNEYMQIMDGPQSNIFQYFKTLLLRGIIVIRKNHTIIKEMIEIMGKGEPDMPCFAMRNLSDVITMFTSRFHLEKTDDECYDIIESMINNSINNWRTVKYDKFQKYTNNISP